MYEILHYHPADKTPSLMGEYRTKRDARKALKELAESWDMTKDPSFTDRYNYNGQGWFHSFYIVKVN